MPSVTGLSHEHAAAALDNGLITTAELNSLQHLIRSPDVGHLGSARGDVVLTDVQSHFLKVPSLPFHSLISVLAKFPATVNGHIPWSTTLRDSLFGMPPAPYRTQRTRN
jgi:hypothetical protein